MTRRRSLPGWRAWRTYEEAPSSARAFLAARAAVLPAQALVAAFAEAQGTVISIGAGHGLAERAIALSNPRVSFTAFELDTARVQMGNATNGRVPSVQLINADVRLLPPTDVFDAGLACDLFHHLPAAAHQAMAEELARRIRPGGLLVVKDIARTPRWKHAWNTLHDRIVAGDRTACRDPAEMALLLARAGFTTECSTRPHPLSPYPHYLLKAVRRPG